MNITELARILRISPQELRDLLPRLGFNIGQKAIKVDNNTAKKIIKDWPILIRQYRYKAAQEAQAKAAAEKAALPQRTLVIPHLISVRDFAAMAQIPVNKILSELMRNGIFVSMNEKIDFDTATIVGSELNIETKLSEEGGQEEAIDTKLADILGKQSSGDLQPRAPIVVVMGHVDHGKTKLLDSIRKTNVMAGEAGGITQHIGAYQVKRKEKAITFIDTPGHEAFTAMRSRGAKVADIAILVVAADDGVKPQTVEAYRIIEAAKIPFIVAINKIDKAEADVNRVKQELSSQLNIVSEDWGGKISCVPISAREGTGIEDLLDIVLLTAEMEQDNLRANPEAQAAGTVIESYIDKGAGPVATILIQNGTLHVGDQLCFNNIFYGKVRDLKNYKGEPIEEASPSMPAKILGLKTLPSVGDILEVGEGEKVKTKKIASGLRIQTAKAPEGSNDDETVKFNLIIKSDFLGSAEAIEESLMKINTEKIRVNIISKGLGNINEGDIKRAEDSQAQIVGFNVKVQPQAEILVREKALPVKMFSIIYDLIKYVKDQMQILLKPEFKRVDIGRLKVLAVFRTESDSQIVGGKVLDGEVINPCLIEVIRDKQLIEKGKLTRLQAGKQDTNLVLKDQECGLKYDGRPLIQVGDILNFYKEEEIATKL